MFVIVTYDIVEPKALNRARKILKKYLTWTQNSVFEGEITPGILNKCIAEVVSVIDSGEDSIYVYEIKNPNNIKKGVYGIHKRYDETFI